MSGNCEVTGFKKTKQCLRIQSRMVTHRELQVALENTATQHRRIGVQSGNLVSLVFPNTPEFVVVFIAVTRVRVIAAPLNANYTEDEFKSFLEGEVLPKAKLELASELEDGAGPKPEDGDEALFLHTSSTPSRPKGVPLAKKNLASSIKNIIATYELTPSDRTLIVMPLFHVHGLMAARLFTVASGWAKENNF